MPYRCVRDVARTASNRPYNPRPLPPRIGSVFLLSQPDLPDTPEALARAIETGLRRFVSSGSELVRLTGNNVRALESLTVNLSGARVDTIEPAARPQVRDVAPAISVGELSVNADPISVFGSEVNFQLDASGAEFQQARQPGDHLLLLLHRARGGQVRIDVARVALEQLISRAAGRLAQKQGVTIESVKLSLAQPEPRSLDAQVAVTARKLLFRAVLNLSGTIRIDDELVANVSNLRCSGEGPIASLACAAITPQFARVEKRPFPLSALPLGEVKLRDVSVALAGNRISIAAKFGSAAELDRVA